MRVFVLIILFHLIAGITSGQKPSKSDLRYRPIDLDDAVLHLEKIHHDSIKQQITSISEHDFVTNSHHGLGMAIRNDWGLWGNGKLSKYFNSIGIYHPDDMSSIILTSYYRHLKKQDRDIETQVKFYQNFWKASNEHYRKLETDTAYRNQIKFSMDSMERVILNEKKNEWSAGKKVSGYVDARCDFINDFINRTQIEGTIIEWIDDSLIIEVTKYYDEKKKKRVIKCHQIVNNRLTVPRHDFFQLME